MLDGFDDKSADFVCTVACTAGAGEEVVVFQERMTVGAIDRTIKHVISDAVQGTIVPGRGPDFGVLSEFHTMIHLR
jgi:hypothetical protein